VKLFHGFIVSCKPEIAEVLVITLKNAFSQFQNIFKRMTCKLNKQGETMKSLGLRLIAMSVRQLNLLMSSDIIPIK